MGGKYQFTAPALRQAQDVTQGEVENTDQQNERIVVRAGEVRERRLPRLRVERSRAGDGWKDKRGTWRSDEGGWYLRFGFDEDFAFDLRTVVTPWARGWRPGKRAWWVADVWIGGVLQMAERWFEIEIEN